MIKIIKFEENMKKVWDDFILYDSRNGNFLFFRNYMEYHADKFNDNSLLIFDDKDVLCAIMPANKRNNTFITHEGLTYGGLIFKKNIGTEKVLLLFENLINYLKGSNFKTIIYKKMPFIYSLAPSEEDLYALYRFDFKIARRDASSCMNIGIYNVKGKKINGYKRGKNNGLSLTKTKDSSNIFSIINENLNKKYGVSSTHTPSEMNHLHNNFPNNIHILELIKDNIVVGGAILYLNKKIIHVQYITCKDSVRKIRGLDFIIVSIIEKYKNEYQWFDYGVSTERNGMFLNTNLIKSKEEFGLTTVCYDTYTLEI